MKGYLNKNICTQLFTFIFVCLLYFIPQPHASAQGKKGAKVEIGGLVTEDDIQKLDNAIVSLLQNGNKVQDIVTDGSGKFSFKLDRLSEYIINITKAGYVTKRLYISTKGIPDNVDISWPSGISVDLFKPFKGLDVSILDNPIGKIYYYSEINTFDYDKNYTKSIQDALDALQRELEKRKATINGRLLSPEEMKRRQKEESDKNEILQKAERQAMLEGVESAKAKATAITKAKQDEDDKFLASVKENEKLKKEMQEEVLKALAEPDVADKQEALAIEKKAKQEAEAKQKAKTDEANQAKAQAEANAILEAALKKKMENEAKAEAEARKIAKQNEADKAKAETQAKAVLEAAYKKQHETEEKAKADADRKAMEEAKRKADEDAKALALLNEENKKRLLAEKDAATKATKAKVDADLKLKIQQQQAAKEEAEAKAKLEAATKKREETEARAKEELARQNAIDNAARAKAEADAIAAQQIVDKKRAEAEAAAKLALAAAELRKKDAIDKARKDSIRLESLQAAIKKKADDDTKAAADAAARIKADAEKRALALAESKRKSDELKAKSIATASNNKSNEIAKESNADAEEVAKANFNRKMTKEEREKFLSELVSKYPEGMTVEEEQFASFKITRIIKRHINEANEFKMIEFKFGNFYKKNDADITEPVFKNETKGYENFIKK